jgi:hypothetical protein
MKRMSTHQETKRVISKHHPLKPEFLWSVAFEGCNTTNLHLHELGSLLSADILIKILYETMNQKI